MVGVRLAVPFSASLLSRVRVAEATTPTAAFGRAIHPTGWGARPLFLWGRNEKDPRLGSPRRGIGHPLPKGPKGEGLEFSKFSFLTLGLKVEGLEFLLFCTTLPRGGRQSSRKQPSPRGEGARGTRADEGSVRSPSEFRWGSPRCYTLAVRVPTQRVREERRKQTEAEKAAWELVRGRRLGTKFRRQYRIDRWIVDLLL